MLGSVRVIDVPASLLFQLCSFEDPPTKEEILELVIEKEVPFIVFHFGLFRIVFL